MSEEKKARERWIAPIMKYDSMFGPIYNATETKQNDLQIRFIEYSALEAERSRSARLVAAIRATLGWFALWNTEVDKSKWPRYVGICEQALAAHHESEEK